MAATREAETVRLMFSCCVCTPEVKLNTDWQMGISSTTVCVVDGIASIAALHWVDNFRLCEKHLRLLAKMVGLVTKNVPLHRSSGDTAERDSEEPGVVKAGAIARRKRGLVCRDPAVGRAEKG